MSGGHARARAAPRTDPEIRLRRAVGASAASVLAVAQGLSLGHGPHGRDRLAAWDMAGARPRPWPKRPLVSGQRQLPVGREIRNADTDEAKSPRPVA